jgi:hypothetical protein
MMTITVVTLVVAAIGVTTVVKVAALITTTAIVLVLFVTLLFYDGKHLCIDDLMVFGIEVVIVRNRSLSAVTLLGPELVICTQPLD